MLSSTATAQFSFTVVSDQRYYAGEGAFDSSNYFRGAIESLAESGTGAFLLSPGDIDPAYESNWTIQQVLGSDFQWYPIVGNHELPGEGTELYLGENMEWLRAFDIDQGGPAEEPNIVRYGPTGCPDTTYSFEHSDAHFVVLNEYCDAGGDAITTGDVTDHLYNWLENDLRSTTKENIFVFGHEPAFPQPDRDNGRLRHESDSLNAHPANRDRFWSLLKSNGVKAYFCGHTHNFSSVEIDGVWQIDSGHARGAGDLGAPSTYLRIDVGSSIVMNVFRDNHNGVYDYSDTVYQEQLNGPVSTIQMSFQQGVSPSANYLGARDATISQATPSRNFGSATVMGVDGDDPSGSGKDLSALLFWDIGAIPQGSTVHNVEVELYISDPTTHGYSLSGLKKGWSENETTWNRANHSTPWNTPGASSPGDRFSSLIGAYSPGRKGPFRFFLNHEGVKLVQSWVDNPAKNHGVVISGSKSTDGFDFHSSEAATAWKRPNLTIYYSKPVVTGDIYPWLYLLLPGK